MSEFVEQSLEELLPVYEQLQRVQLFEPEEIRQIIRRCRRYEYRLHKQTKRPEDFVRYADYMADFLQLIGQRRRRIRYYHKRTEIDGAVRQKVEALFRRCTMRFQDRRDVWMKRIDFAKRTHMNNAASRHYKRMLQVHGSDPALWMDAAVWEFFGNGSAVNARALLQMALRRFPDDRRLWLTLFDIEVAYVKRLKKRAGFLKKALDRERKAARGPQAKKRKKNDSDSDASDDDNNMEGNVEKAEEEKVPDAVLQLKLAEVVARQALAAVPAADRPLLLLDLWRRAKRRGAATKELCRTLGERLSADFPTSEEAQLAKIEDCADLGDRFGAFEAAIGQLPTEKMLRAFKDFCEARIDTDPLALHKLVDVLRQLRDRGWMSVEDGVRLCTLDEEATGEEKLKILEQVLVRHPQSVELWTALLRLKIDEGAATKKDIRRLFNKATTAVSESATLPLYRLAIEWLAAVGSSTDVCALYSQSFAAPAVVSAPLKAAYLRFLATTDTGDYRSEYRRLARMTPTSLAFHQCAQSLENCRPAPDVGWLKESHELSVAEWGDHSVDCWIDYVRFALRHRPDLAAKVHQRATIRLSGEDADRFTLEWTLLMRESTSDQ